jgi:hypothetical protein
MQHSDNEYDRAYREKFRGVRPIIEKHFVGFEQKIIMDMTHRFIAGEEFELFESWNFKKQQKKSDEASRPISKGENKP